jgi:hypothetical protein
MGGDESSDEKAVRSKLLLPRVVQKATRRQGNRSVEDYYKEMEIAMIRTNVEEDR